MSLPIILLPEALGDIEINEFWYRKQSEQAAELFVQRVTDTIRKVTESPLIYGLIHRKIRRAPVYKFPHGIFYQVEKDRIRIIAVYHGKRLPRGWMRRI